MSSADVKKQPTAFDITTDTAFFHDGIEVKKDLVQDIIEDRIRKTKLNKRLSKLQSPLKLTGEKSIDNDFQLRSQAIRKIMQKTINSICWILDEYFEKERNRKFIQNDNAVSYIASQLHIKLSN